MSQRFLIFLGWCKPITAIHRQRLRTFARDLPPEKRHPAEDLPGGALSEDELVLIRCSKGRILEPGLTGDALAEAYRQLFDWSAEMAKRVEHVPECEIDAAIDEAVDFVRHRRG